MRNLDSQQRVVLECYHCGNKTQMDQQGQYSWDSHDDGFRFAFSYELFECPVCHKATLREKYTDESMIDGWLYLKKFIPHRWTGYVLLVN